MLLDAGLRVPLVAGSGKASGNQVLGLPRTYARLVQYSWAFQSRRSPLIWKVYGKRLDGFHNDDIPSPPLDYEDEKMSKRGVIAFQLHSGGPLEVRFKDIKLEVPGEKK